MIRDRGRFVIENETRSMMIHTNFEEVQFNSACQDIEANSTRCLSSICDFFFFVAESGGLVDGRKEMQVRPKWESADLLKFPHTSHPAKGANVDRGSE